MTSRTTLPAGYHAGHDHDPEQYWRRTKDSYPHYPTIRHRQRFIRDVLRRQGLNEHSFIFEYGCGSGGVLRHLRDHFHLRADQLGGCDIAQTAIELSRQALGSPYLFVSTAPPLPRSADVVICTEVLEHTTKYEKILEWAGDHLIPGGAFVVTTQAGRIHASDRYTGHTQHFRLSELTALLKRLNFTVERARLWGWPLFTLQKYLTDVNFEGVQHRYLEGDLTFKKRLVFNLAYALYHFHDWIPFGPQIYIVARKPK
jgi:SAM-dependent methyltransferase